MHQDNYYLEKIIIYTNKNFCLSLMYAWSVFKRRWDKWIVIINISFESFARKRNREIEGFPEWDKK